MPFINEPYRDPEERRRRKRRRVPRALIRLRRQYTPDLQLADFQERFGREPVTDEELERFVDEHLRELYNSGVDEI